MPPKGKVAAKAAPKKRKIDDDEDENEGSGDESGGSSDTGSSSGGDSDDDSDNDDGTGTGSDDGSDDGSDEDSDKDEDDDEPPKKKGRTAAAGKGKAATKKVTKKDAKKATKKASKAVVKKAVKREIKKESSSSNGEKKLAKIKSLRKTERLEEARKAYKWWEAPKLATGVNWKYMEHAGICFAPPYEPHGIPLIYDGEPITLTPPQEEVASFFAAIPADGPQLGNAKTKPVFEKNFFDDFKEVLGPGHKIKKFSLCDFSKIKAFLDLQKNLRKAATDEEKAARKAEKETVLLRYGYALIDGRVEKVGVMLVSASYVAFSLSRY